MAQMAYVVKRPILHSLSTAELSTTVCSPAIAQIIAAGQSGPLGPATNTQTHTQRIAPPNPPPKPLLPSPLLPISADGQSTHNPPVVQDQSGTTSIPAAQGGTTSIPAAQGEDATNPQVPHITRPMGTGTDPPDAQPTAFPRSGQPPHLPVLLPSRPAVSPPAQVHTQSNPCGGCPRGPCNRNQTSATFSVLQAGPTPRMMECGLVDANMQEPPPPPGELPREMVATLCAMCATPCGTMRCACCHGLRLEVR